MNKSEYDNSEDKATPDELSEDNFENEQDNSLPDVAKISIIVAIFSFITSIGMGIKTWKSKRALKKANIALEKEREKNKLYQEALKKHQAEINALKDDLEREEYKNQLWEELKSITEG